MTDPTTKLAAFVISLQKSTILIPNATVAEVIPYEPLQRLPETPDWFLGFLGWRGVQVPVVAFEMLTVERGSFSLVSVASASLVILRSLNAEDDFSFLAIAAQAVPRMVQISADDLFEIEEEANVTELVRAQYQDEIISIPDIDYLENEIRKIAYLGV